MDRKKKIIGLLAAGALALVAGFAAISSRTVYAQTATPTQTAPGNGQPQQAQPGPGWAGRGKGGPGGMRGGYSDQDLATALGITTDQLQAAYQTANTEALKEAVSKGLITQAQADQLSANGLDQHRLFDRFGGSNGIDYNTILAKALGITPDKLQAAYQQAFDANIDTAVKNGSLTQAQADAMKGNYALRNNTKFQEAIKSAYEAAVKQAVTDGVITQAQADAILQNQSQSGGFFNGGFGPGRHGGGFGHPGLNGGMNNNQNNQSAPTPSSSSTGL